MAEGKEGTIPIPKEEGIIQKSGKGFHSINDFARKHLIYAAWSSRYLCSSRYTVRRDFLDFFSLIYVISGKMEFVYEGQTMIVSENEAILLDFRKPHYYRSMTERTEKWELIFDGNASDAFYELIVSRWGNVFKVHGRIKGVISQMMTSLDSPLPDDFELSLLFNSLFTYVLMDHQSKQSPPIRKALEYINEHSSDSMQINEIANYVGLSRSYFSRLFAKETGQTPYDYLLESRINKAKQMLALDETSVAMVAELCGFQNASHFIRVFREKTGQTPASFRNFFNIRL